MLILSKDIEFDDDLKDRFLINIVSNVIAKELSDCGNLQILHLVGIASLRLR